MNVPHPYPDRPPNGTSGPAWFPAEPAPLPPPRRRPAVLIGSILAAVVVLCCGGGIGVLGSLVDPAPQPVASGVPVDAAAPTASAVDDVPSASPTPGPSASPLLPTASSATPTAPIVQQRTVTETRSIPYARKTVEDPSLAEGTRKIRTRGVNGVRTLVYEVTLTDGRQTSRRLVREQVTRAPVTEVTVVGTRKASRCDPNYSGACVPIASDVDCAGGSGNGPAYVEGPVRVIGRDIYDLDRDGDGIGCDD